MSDASSVEADDMADGSPAFDDEPEGDDCEFEEYDDDDDDGVLISEDVGSDLVDFIVDDKAEEGEEGGNDGEDDNKMCVVFSLRSLRRVNGGFLFHFYLV